MRLSFVPMDLQNEGDDNVLDTEHICRFLEDGATLLVRLNKLDWEQLAKNITANASGGATRVVSQNTFSTADAMKPLEKENRLHEAMRSRWILTDKNAGRRTGAKPLDESRRS